MKKTNLLTVIILVISITSPLQAQLSAIGNIKTEIVVPLSVIETQQLNFGKISSAAQGGTILISPNGERVNTGELSLVDDQFSAGKFILSGSPNSLISISLPQTPQVVRLTSGGQELIINQFISSIPAEGQLIDQVDGKVVVSIGASLIIGNSTSGPPPGLYIGMYEVVFMYN